MPVNDPAVLRSQQIPVERMMHAIAARDANTGVLVACRVNFFTTTWENSGIPPHLEDSIRRKSLRLRNLLHTAWRYDPCHVHASRR